jgi:DcmR-like sensory protein
MACADKRQASMSVDTAAAFTALESTCVPGVQWHPREQSGHIVQFYSDGVFLLDALSRFIGTALGSGDCAVVIATQEHLDGLAKRLKTRGFDLNKAAKQSRYMPLDASQTLAKFMVDGQPDAQRFFSLIGNAIERAHTAAEGKESRVVAFGEMVALLWAGGQKDAALRLERLWNDLAKTHAFFLRCAYPMKDFNQERDGQAFLSICGEHSGVIPSESYSALDTDEERFRNIAQLQQKAEALESE